jgi:methionyl-tRNA formyltransferase
MAGDEVTGATTFLVERGLDTGPTFGVMTEAIRADDTSGDLLGRLAEAGAGLLVATLDAIEAGELHAVTQPGEGVSLAPKISVRDARIRWGTPALSVDRHVRGCTPAPGAWTMFRGERLKIHPVTVGFGAALAQDDVVSAPDVASAEARSATALAPGGIDATKRAVRVGTASGAVLLGTVQPHGKKPMHAADWARGVRIEPGEMFADE